MIHSICVYCASSTKIDDKYFEAAHLLGQKIGQLGITLINGAGNLGLMQASTDGCLEAGGRAIGVIPSFMIAENWCHQSMTEIVETPDMHTRQQKMAELSDAAIILPGGCGTMAELTELITWKQLGLYLKPIVILNIDGYYNSLLEMLHRAADEHFMRNEHTAIWRVAQSVDEALQLAMSTPLWDTQVRKFAAI